MEANGQYAIVSETLNAGGDQHQWCRDVTSPTYADGTGGFDNGVRGGGTAQTQDGLFKTWYNFVGEIPPPTFTVTVNDIYDSAALQNFTITLFNSTSSNTTSTTSGSIGFTKVGGLMNVNVTGVTDNGGYFNRSFTNVDSSSSFVAGTFQSVINFNASSIISGTVITDFNVSVPLASNTSNALGIATLLLKAQDYNVSGQAVGFFNKTQNFTASPLQNITIPLFFGTHRLKIEAVVFLGNTTSPILPFTVTLTGVNVTFSETKSTAVGNIIFDIEDGNYSIFMTSSGFVSKTQAVQVSNTTENATVTLFNQNSIFLRTFREGTTTLINFTTVTYSFDSIPSVFSRTTNNGSINLLTVTPEDYTLEVSATGFNTQTYIFTLGVASNVQLDTFLSNTSNTAAITFKIKDASNSNIIEGATVTVQDKIGLNFVTITQGVTDISGNVLFDLDQTTTYQFIITVPNFNTKIFLLKPILTDYEINIDPTIVADFTTLFSSIDFLITPVNNFLTDISGLLNFSITTTSLTGTLISYFGLNTTLDGVTSLTNITTSPSGGTATILLNFSGANQTSIDFDYFIQVDGQEIILLHRGYFTANITVGNQSLTQGGLRDIIQNVPAPIAVATAVMMVILIMATLASLGIRDRRLNMIGGSFLLMMIPLGLITGTAAISFTVVVSIILLASYFIAGSGDVGG